MDARAGLAVGCYHCQRGNHVGAGRQLRKGLRKLAEYLPSCEGIDTARLYREGLAALERLETGVLPPQYPQIHTHAAS